MQCRVPLGGSLPGQQALPCVPGPREQHSRQALGHPPQVGSLRVRAGLTALVAHGNATQGEGRLAPKPPTGGPACMS